MRPLSWSSSYLLRDPLGISTTTGTPVSLSTGGLGLSPPDPPGSVPDEAEELIALDLLAPVQEAELDEGGDADHLAAEPLDQPGGGPRGAAGGEHVVHDQHPLAGGDRVGVELEGGGAVLQRVLLGLDAVRQLAGLADGHEAGAEVVGDRRGEDEAARLDADHLVDGAAAEVDDGLVDDRGEGDLAGEQRRRLAGRDGCRPEGMRRCWAGRGFCGWRVGAGATPARSSWSVSVSASASSASGRSSSGSGSSSATRPGASGSGGGGAARRRPAAVPAALRPAWGAAIVRAPRPVTAARPARSGLSPVTPWAASRSTRARSCA